MKDTLLWLTLCLASGWVTAKIGRDLKATLAVATIAVGLAIGAILGWLL